jgi:hypothetical protein
MLSSLESLYDAAQERGTPVAVIDRFVAQAAAALAGRETVGRQSLAQLRLAWNRIVEEYGLDAGYWFAVWRSAYATYTRY